MEKKTVGIENCELYKCNGNPWHRTCPTITNKRRESSTPLWNTRIITGRRERSDAGICLIKPFVPEWVSTISAGINRLVRESI